jgi:hypothetical protein
MIQNNYSGHIKELLIQIKELENKLIFIKSNMKIIQQQHDNELFIEKYKNEIIHKIHKNGLKDKDIQLLEYKIGIKS